MRCSRNGSTPRSAQRASRSRSSVANPTVLSAGRSWRGQATAALSPSSRSPASSSRMMPSCSALVISRGGGSPVRCAASRSTAKAYECTERTSGSRTTGATAGAASSGASDRAAGLRAEPGRTRQQQNGFRIGAGGDVRDGGRRSARWSCRCPARRARAPHRECRARSTLVEVRVGDVRCGHVGMTPRGSDKPCAVAVPAASTP